jgi:hypothetical protein
MANKSLKKEQLKTCLADCERNKHMDGQKDLPNVKNMKWLEQRWIVDNEHNVRVQILIQRTCET